MRRDPVTGDELTRGEYISWTVQGLIRNWTFLIIITLITLIVWATNNSTALLWWNLGASYLALVIEGVTAMALINQTKRDAVITRQIRTISQHIEKLTEAVLKDVTTIEEQLSAEEHLDLEDL